MPDHIHMTRALFQYQVYTSADFSIHINYPCNEFISQAVSCVERPDHHHLVTTKLVMAFDHQLFGRQELLMTLDHQL